ncbi:MAG: hypothetical protein EXS00_01895 [Phycisphaerales bacterium]|nr:hypothetical protein [Phycisphaerales bacterium]
MGLLGSIVRQCILRPASIAVVDDQKQWRRIELLIAAMHIARAVDDATSAPRVGVLLPTSGMFPAAAMATWMLGRTVVPINYLLSRSDIEFICRDAGLDCCITVKPMLDLIGGAPAGVRPISLESLSFRGVPPLLWPRGLASGDLAAVLYTSGTSGKPKGVMLTEENLRTNINQVVSRARFNRQDSVLGVLPQFHSFGLTILTLLPLAIGCKAVYTARFIPKRIIELAKRHHPTVFVGIPSMYNAIASVRDTSGDELASLRYAVSGGEPLSQAVSDAFYAKFRVRISEGYGLTETAPVSNWCRPEEYRFRSVGRPVDGVSERIVASDGREMPQGEEGEIRIKGPNVMRGYLNLPEESAQAFDDEGYFRTGDMGKFDADGHLFITGRIKEMLIISGENVFPREIEEVLNRHAAVKDSAVIGAADASRGEVPVAFVELNPDAQFDEGALRQHCREHLPPYKCPREVMVLASLPRNATGKIMRRQLPTL